MARRRDSVPHGRVRRAAPLAGLTARTLGGRLIAGARESTGAQGAVQRADERAARRYAALLGRSRGALMKAGQLLSMVDARGWGGGGFEPYLKALSRLQSDVPVMDPVLVGDLIEADLSNGVGQFADFTVEPFATASIGQVHRAVLCDGRQVAVKIQYPGVARAIEDDLANVELMATFLRLARAATVLRGDIGDVAHTVAARIREEVDYRHEATMTSVFCELYRDHPFIQIPEVIAEASGDRVLTVTYLGGMDWVQAQHADQELKNTWAEAILRFAYSNRWLAGLLHADPHPGNYRFFADGTVGFLDFGCVHVLSEAQRCGWFAMTRAAVEGRKSDLRDAMERAGYLDDDKDLTAEELYQWWSELLHDIIVEPQPVTYTPDSCARVTTSLFDFQDRHRPLARVRIPGAAAITARIQLNLISICTGLSATLPVRAIADDTDGACAPITRLGQQHHAWIRERGLALTPSAPGR